MRVEPFVALQADQARAEDVGEDLGALGLSHAGGALDEQRLLERQHELKRGGERVADDEVAFGEPVANGSRVDHAGLVRNACGSFTNWSGSRRSRSSKSYLRAPLCGGRSLCRRPCDRPGRLRSRDANPAPGAAWRTPRDVDPGGASVSGDSLARDGSARSRQGSTARPPARFAHRDRAPQDCGSRPHGERRCPRAPTGPSAPRFLDATRPTYDGGVARITCSASSS